MATGYAAASISTACGETGLSPLRDASAACCLPCAEAAGALRSARPSLQEMPMHPALSNLSKHLFPAAIVLTVVTLLAGDGALAILCMVAGLIALPLAYAGEVDDIARAAREGRFRD
jgi:hypothetical protein